MDCNSYIAFAVHGFLRRRSGQASSPRRACALTVHPEPVEGIVEAQTRIECYSPLVGPRDEIRHPHSPDVHAGAGRPAGGFLPLYVRADRRGGKTRLRSSLGDRASFWRLWRHVAASADVSRRRGTDDFAHPPRYRGCGAAAAQSARSGRSLRDGGRHFQRTSGFRHRQRQRTGRISKIRREPE